MEKNPSGYKPVVFTHIVCCLVLLVSCSKSPEQKILGKWHEVGGTETIEFFEKGLINIEDEGEVVGGTYEITGAGEIVLQISGVGELAGPVRVTGTLTEEGLTFKWPDDTIYKFSRPE